MTDLNNWVKVVSDPLGIAAFALFLIFILLSRTATKQQRWLMPVFILLAIITLLGGLTLSFKGIIPKGTPVERYKDISININTEGDNSHGTAFNNGNVGNTEKSSND